MILSTTRQDIVMWIPQRVALEVRLQHHSKHLLENSSTSLLACWFRLLMITKCCSNHLLSSKYLLSCCPTFIHPLFLHYRSKSLFSGPSIGWKMTIWSSIDETHSHFGCFLSLHNQFCVSIYLPPWCKGRSIYFLIVSASRLATSSHCSNIRG